ncbi:RpiB/LacA/LacB family sugar-phosphate isomerase [Candidatus Saccharibacteria bacterium]|nr:RpiB/LacA/LacB family sugar-phosphate isomerase [Candidatus Saccharibacteria bacterium]
MIYLGADHRGFEIKNNIFKFLKNSGLDVKDVGAYNYDPKDDYNDFAVTVARAVRREKESCGILICGSGIGMSIQANRFKGVRATAATDDRLVKVSREHNNANVLCLSADVSSEEQMQELIKTFLTTPFLAEPKYIHRNVRLDEREDYA